MTDKIIKILGLCEPEKRGEFEDIVNAPHINCLSILNIAEDTPDKAAAYPANCIVMLSEELSDTEADFMNAYFNIRKGTASILVVKGEKTLDIMEKAMACGFGKVMSIADGNTTICNAVVDEAEKVAERDSNARTREYDSKVIAFYSPKGGAGKTSTSTNVATELYNRGKKVTIIDMDLSFGDVNAALNIAPGDTIAEICEERHLTPKVIKGYLRESSCGPLVISAPTSPERASIVDADIVAKVIETLRADNDYVVIDCYQQLDDCTRRVLKECDIIYLVINPEIPNVFSAETFRKKFVDPHVYNDKVKMIINKAGISSIKDSQIEDKIGMPVFAKIPFDAKAVASSLNMGEPVMSKRNDTSLMFKPPIKKAFEALVTKIEKVGETVGSDI